MKKSANTIGRINVKHRRAEDPLASRLRRTQRLRIGSGIAAIVGVALIALSCGGGLGSDAQLPTTQPGRLTKILDDLAYAVAVPQYQATTAAFVELQGTTAAFCASPDASGLEAVRGAWRRAMESWVTASTIELGPIGDDNRDLRVAFWPDANNNVARAVEQQLLRDDELSAATLAQQSVAGQGLPAFERLLFEPDADVLAAFTTGDRAARRCTYAQAIAGNLVAIARAVEDGWTAEGGYAHQLAFAGRGSDVFATREAAIDDVVNGLVTTLAVTRDGRIGDPLGGDTAADAKPFRAESFLSGNSLADLAAAVRGAGATYDAGGAFGFDDYLRSSGRDALAAEITAELRDLQARIAAIPVPLAAAVVDDAYRPAVVGLLDRATALTRLIESELSAAMDVTIGFNENDGD